MPCGVNNLPLISAGAVLLSRPRLVTMLVPIFSKNEVAPALAPT